MSHLLTFRQLREIKSVQGRLDYLRIEKESNEKDIKQLENETVIQNFSKALKTLEEFKVRAMELAIPDILLLPDHIEALIAIKI